MVALFKLLVLVIFAIIFYFFVGCARLVAGAGNYIAGTGQNTISRDYESYSLPHKIFYEHIKISREYAPYDFEEGTIQEFIFALELYFFFMATILYGLEIKSTYEGNALENNFLYGILEYIDSNRNTLIFSSKSASDTLFMKDFYTISNLKTLFNNRYNYYLVFFASIPVKDSHSIDGTLQHITHIQKRTSMIKNFLFDDLKSHMSSINSRNLYTVIVSDSNNNEIFMRMLTDISIMAVEFSKELIRAALSKSF